MAFFGKKEPPIILQPTAGTPVITTPTTIQPLPPVKVEPNLLEQKKYEILEERTTMLKERTDHLSTAIKLRENTLNDILDLVKNLKEKIENQDKLLEKIEKFLKENSDGTYQIEDKT